MSMSIKTERRKCHDWILVNYEKNRRTGEVTSCNAWKIEWDIGAYLLEFYLDEEILSDFKDRGIELWGYARLADGEKGELESEIIYNGAVEDYLAEHGMKTEEDGEYIFFWKEQRIMPLKQKLGFDLN